MKFVLSVVWQNYRNIYVNRVDKPTKMLEWRFFEHQEKWCNSSQASTKGNLFKYLSSKAVFLCLCVSELNYLIISQRALIQELIVEGEVT